MLEMKDKLPLDHLPLDQSTGTPGSSVGRVSSIEIRDNIAHKTINLNLSPVNTYNEDIITIVVYEGTHSKK